jgi:Kef-type K+ transport system membrane component KefB
MKEVSFNGLLIVTVVAFAAPIVVAAIRWVKFPSPVLEIIAGIAIGPAGLGWVKVNPPIQILSLVGLAFLLFLAGLDIDLMSLKGRVLQLSFAGFVLSLVLGLAAAALFQSLGWVRSPFFVAVVLAATSLGLVVPVLKDAERLDSTLGHLVVGGASVAEFGTVILLSLFFSQSRGTAASKVVTFAAFVLVVLTVGLALSRAGRNARINRVLIRLQDTTAELRVRAAVALLIGFVALAAEVGLETILGAFIAGVILSIADRDSNNHPNFRSKLDAIGYGFVIPVFFVTTGLRFDVHALTANPSAILRVPLFLLAILLARGLPAALYRRQVGSRGAFAAAFLQATTLPFIVTATTIGVAIDAIRPVTGAALVAAGVLSVIFFPSIALTIAGPTKTATATTPIQAKRPRSWSTDRI